MSGHTTGPWAYSTSEDGWTFNIYHADYAAFTPECSNVATLFVRTVECDQHTTQEANARLIASSPTLLSALQAIVASLAEHDDEGMIEHAEQMVAARAAIAAATEEPK